MSATVLAPFSLKISTSSSSHRKLPLSSARCLTFPRSAMLARDAFRRNSISPTNPPVENESKSVLDAFFLGKALAEVMNEHAESALGEFLSTIGRIQATNQKYIQEFQEEVVERANKAQAKAVQESMAPQGPIPKASPDSSPGNLTMPSDNNGPSTSDGKDPLVAMMTEE